MKRALLILSGLSVGLGGEAGAEMAASIDTIRSVDREGQGNVAASKAWQELSAADAEQLPTLLKGMDGANPLAQNWLRAAVEAVAARAEADGSLPVDLLTRFLGDTSHDAAPRVLTYQLLKEAAPEEVKAMYSALAQDPVASLRVDPVAAMMSEARSKSDAGEKEAAKALYLEALDAARSKEQIDVLAAELEGLGEKVDLPSQFGFLMDWHLIAPFSNEGREGFDRVFPPEEGVDLEASYPGKGEEVAWVAYRSEDDYGKVDFNQPYGMIKEVVGYAYTTFNAAEERDAELRLGGKNAWKVWLNGELLFGRDEYHRGKKMDQYTLPVRLKKGSNTILVKCCQNEQTEEWTADWDFQLRVCDATGTAIAPAN